MVVTFRAYVPRSEDAIHVREFLMRINESNMETSRFLWGAWEWAVTHGARDKKHEHRIGLWEENRKIVALATYELGLGEAILITGHGYDELKPELVRYAKERLHDEGSLWISIQDEDGLLQRAAFEAGLRPTQKVERIAKIEIARTEEPSLPPGFHFVSLADDWDWEQYNQVMWRGFNHEGEAPDDETEIDGRREMLSSSAIIPELIISIANEEGEYVAHCGVWYEPGERYSYIEPVATRPDYRKQGLGKAVVYEAIRRSGALGAKEAIVSSDQQFYYNIGFVPFRTWTRWQITT